jgi:hypothetical protein
LALPLWPTAVRLNCHGLRRPPRDTAWWSKLIKFETLV